MGVHWALGSSHFSFPPSFPQILGFIMAGRVAPRRYFGDIVVAGAVRRPDSLPHPVPSLSHPVPSPMGIGWAGTGYPRPYPPHPGCACLRAERTAARHWHGRIIRLLVHSRPPSPSPPSPRLVSSLSLYSEVRARQRGAKMRGGRVVEPGSWEGGAGGGFCPA